MQREEENVMEYSRRGGGRRQGESFMRVRLEGGCLLSCRKDLHRGGDGKGKQF